MLFWFLLTVLNILSSYKRRLSNKQRSFPLISASLPDTVTKIKCSIWDKYTYIEEIQRTSSSGIYKTNLYFIMIVIYGYLLSNFK